MHVEKGFSINWAKPQDLRRKSRDVYETAVNPGLAAIILATKSSRGESVVFHYPPEPHHDPRWHSDSGDMGSDSDLDEDDPPAFPRRSFYAARATENHMPTIPERENSKEGGEEDWVPAWRKIFNLDSSLLADIFTPQKSDPKFEMWIDDLVFLGMPVHLRPDGSWMRPRNVRHVDEVQREADGMDSAVPKIDLANSIEALDKLITPGEPSTNGAQPFVADTSSPMTSFHLIFALSTKMDSNYQRHITEMYDHVVTQLTIALTYEQAKCGYVWNQCEMMRAIKRKGELNRTNIATVWHDIMQQSDLAGVIQQTYGAISNGEVAHLLINRRLNLSLALPHHITSVLLPRDGEHEHPFLTSALSFGTSMNEADCTLLPHFGLVLLEEPSNILAAMPARSGPMLRKFVTVIQPTRSFYALADVMRIPLAETLDLARCLLRWKCAVPMPPLHPRNVYMVSPTSDMSQLSKHSLIFARKFPNVPPLPAMLANLSQQQVPYESFIPDEDQTDLYLDVLAWMMREKWLIQVRTFVWVKIRAEIKLAVARDQLDGHIEEEEEEEEEAEEDPWGRHEENILHEEMFEESIISDPYNASEQEQLWLTKLETYHPMADAALFRQVCKYFNGTHAIEKIIVREKVDPRALVRLLDIFDEDLIQSHTW